MGPIVSSVAITQTNGLDRLNSKPKATWARLNRMECGLSESARDICTPNLGKRAATSTLFAEHEEHHRKSGRVETGEANHDEISTRVESHHCREQ